MRKATMGWVVVLIVLSGVSRLTSQSPELKPEMPASDFLKARYAGGKTHLIALAERMPETDYGFRPTPETEPFGVRIAHIAGMNFEKCAYIVDAKNPHEGRDLPRTFTTKAELLQLLKDSFAFCDGYMMRLSPQVMAETLAAPAPPAAPFKTVKVDRAGVAIDVVTHNAEMYGYLAVYLRLKGLIPPTSQPDRGGRGGGND